MLPPAVGLSPVRRRGDHIRRARDGPSRDGRREAADDALRALNGPYTSLVTAMIIPITTNRMTAACIQIQVGDIARRSLLGPPPRSPAGQGARRERVEDHYRM